MSGESELFFGQMLGSELHERIERRTWYESGSTRGFVHHCPVCGPSDVMAWDWVTEEAFRHRYHGRKPPGGPPKLRFRGWPTRRISGRTPAKVRR